MHILVLLSFDLISGLRPEKIEACVMVPPVPVRVPSQRPLDSSVTSVTNDKGNNEMIPGLCTDLLVAEENPGKPLLADRLMKRLCHIWGSLSRNEIRQVKRLL